MPRPSKEELRKRTPVGVELDLSGPFYIVQTFNNDDRDRIIVARSESAALATFKRMLPQYDGLIAKGYYFGQVTAPTQQYCDAVAKYAYDCDVRQLKSMLESVLEKYVDNDLTVPEGVRVCGPDTYKVSRSRAKSYDYVDPATDTAHELCANCERDRISLDGIDMDALYAKNIETGATAAYENHHGARFTEPTPASFIPAKKIKGTTSYFIAGRDTWGGTIVCSLKNSSPRSRMLFFLQGQELPVPGAFADAVSQYKAAATRQESQQREKDERHRKQQAARYLEATKKLVNTLFGT